MTYILSTTPLSRIAEDGTGLYALSDSAYGPVICYMRFTPEDADYWSRLLNAQAEKAWREGFEQGKEECCGMGTSGNPYTVQSETDGTVPKTD